MNKKLSIKELTLTSMCTALMAIFSQLSIPLPFTTIPLTLQTLGIVLIAIILEHKISTLSILLWILIGMIGIPVFSGFSGGIGVIVGPTGGYILGFIFMTYIIGYLSSKKNNVFLFFGLYVGQIVQYTFGVFQMKQVLGLTINQSLATGVYPFIIKDVILITLGAFIALSIKKILISSNVYNF